MRCLKRNVAREIYHQIFNPKPAPNNTDLGQQHNKLGFAINAVASHLNQWPSVISRLERGLIRNDALAATYRQWLADQTPQTTNLTAIGASRDDSGCTANSNVPSEF